MATADTSKLIVDTFKKFDANGDGKISRDELKRVLKAISGDKFDDASVDAMLSACDTNKDGFVQYEEFVNWVTQENGKTQAKSDRSGSKDALDQRGKFTLDYRKLLPERFEVDIKTRYNVDNLEIGAGGFGKVFIARDKECSNRKVAVKKVPKTSKTPTESGNLAAEIQVMKDLDHPNICKLLATFEEGRNIFFIMELCEGGEVFDRIIENGFITEKVAATILAQVCSALAYAHYRGIAHRDIKPENVVFCTKEPDDNRVKVIDWGLATNFTESAMTKAVGSMTYAAPEVIASNDQKAYTAACDLWSVGVLAYVMLCGKPPFWGSREQHYKNAKNERYPFKAPPWDRMNPDAKDFVKVLLKAKPAERLPMEKVVQHAWLVSPPTESDSTLSASVVSNLKEFSAQSTFSRLCITAVARQLDHKQLKDIHKVFREMDLDGNGVLTANEVKQGMSKMGGGLGGADIDAMFANLDMDGSHTIDYTEFCAAALGQFNSSQDDVIWAAFKTFDLENTGYITVDNLKKILDSADVKDIWSADVCEDVGRDIVAMYDKDGDGSISFDDWRKLMGECWQKKRDVNFAESPYDLLAKVSKLA
mmetsp:Transcript_1783/g.3044  ORF Transcript_1783/g.3044 Transcript_1783/m.3044 type:complete len:592 (-) Transcript_1783:71-1846(-)